MIKKYCFAVLVFALALCSGSQVAQAAPLNGWGWSDNIGWISLNCANTNSCATSNYSVENYGTSLAGNAWSDNIGWINFGPVQVASNGRVSGSARALAPNLDGSSGWDGKIQLASTGTGPAYETTIGPNNSLTGWAWGDTVVGWINFVGSDGATTTPPCTGTNCPPNCPPGNNCYPSGGYCGDGIVNGGEECDGSVPSGTMCPAGTTGTVTCNPPAGGSGSSPVNSAGGASTIGGVINSSAVINAIGRGDGSSSFSSGSTGSPSGSNSPCRFNTSQCINIPPAPCPDPNNPVCANIPTLTRVNGQDRISITSQPLTSPAISSTMPLQATGGSASTALNVKVISINSAVGNHGSLLVPDILNPAQYPNQQLPKCRLSRQPVTAQTPISEFVDCANMPALSMYGETDHNLGYFNIRFHRPVAVLNANNPYIITLGDSAAGQTTGFLLEYQVSTVNPF